MECGDTVLMPAGPQGWLHLWIMATPAEAASGRAVFVSVTTLRRAADQTLFLRRGDHPFVRHESVIHFADARILDSRRIEEDVRKGALEAHEPCSGRLIDEIRSGLRASPFTAKKVLEFLRASA